MTNDKPYDVGYGKPPQRTQFTKGRSGNPAGRPRKKSGLSADPFEDIHNTLQGTILVKGKRKKIFGMEVKYRGWAINAAKGNVNAARLLLEEERELLSEIVKLQGFTPGGPGRGRYLVVPAIMPTEIWEQVAMEQQARLVRETREC